MYENYTYEQIKSLPDEQKVEALKELKAIYPVNKDMAEHLGVKPVVTSNLVSKFVEGKQVGRKAMTDEEKAQKKAQRKADKKLKEQQELQQQTEPQQEQQETKTETPSIVSNQPNNEVNETPKPKSNAFGITLNKTLSGEEAIKRFNGIANSLLDECEYKIEVSIEEV